MKKLAVIFFASLAVSACNDALVEKPDNLISEPVMVDIIYDLALLESIKSQKPMSLSQYSLDPKTYIYRKYNIDSAQFANSNRYYSSDLEGYKKIYEKVDKKLDVQKTAVDSLIKATGAKRVELDPDAPRVE